MHSIAIASLLAAAATFTSAAPTAPTANRPRAWYVCANNGFRGECSKDPCAVSWCPDYKPYTYEPVGSTVVTPPTSTGSHYVCANNGFNGQCSVDPCAISWCPDYKPYTYEPATSTVPPVTPPVAPAPKSWYVCANNGFRGECSKDPCALAWCPDYKPYTYEPVTAWKRADPTVCAAGTGYFQSCSNGFRGCCKADACGNTWCPDYKYGTYEPISTIPKTETVPKTETKPAPVNVDPSVCPSGTGYYQVCASGFKGCCKTDACTKGYCSA